MRSRPIPRPTDAELDILRALWRRGPSTVRELQEDQRSQQARGYTTLLKLLQIMSEKGLVTRDETARAHVYAARLSQEQTQRQLLRDLTDKAFSGSTGKLVLRALSSRPASEAELAEIRRLLDKMEGRTQ
jgi:predicted transcriptional regulator